MTSKMTTPGTPLERALQNQLRILETTLQPGTVRSYRWAIRNFLDFLRRRFSEVSRPNQLQRDPHLLCWLEELWNYRTRLGQPLHTATRGARILNLRTLLDGMRDGLAQPPAANLLLRGDIPRRQFPLPRPLNMEDDLRLRQYWDSSTGLLDTALYLMRLTGMRIGECADLAPDCLRQLGEGRWSIHVPHGKPLSERWVPVEETARKLVERLAFLRLLPPGPAPEFLLPRPKGRQWLMEELRSALRRATAAAGLSGHFVPHQLRHTYATTLLRAGVSLPALMRLLGHHNACITLLYLEITQTDLHREYHSALENPRYLIPAPPTLALVQPAAPLSLDSALEQAIQLLNAQRSSGVGGPSDRLLLLLARRLTRIRALVAKSLPRMLDEK